MRTVEDHLPIAIDLENIHTHQCCFSRGYWIGVAQTEAGHRLRTGFVLRLPAAYLDDLAEALPGWRQQVVARDRNALSVEFVTVKIEPI